MLTCTNCKSVNASASRYCAHCGSSLEESISTKMTHLVSRMATSILGGGKTSKPQAPDVTSRRAVPPPVYPPQTGLRQRELLVIVNDISISMDWRFSDNQTKLEAAVQASQQMVMQKALIDSLDEIGLVAFAAKARIVEPLRTVGSFQTQLLAALQNLKSRGGTDINEGLKVADGLLQWHRRDVVRRIVLLTDGQGGKPLGTAASLKARGVVIDVVGVGPDPSEVDENLLRQVASAVQGRSRYRFIRDSQTLTQHYTSLAQKTRLH